MPSFIPYLSFILRYPSVRSLFSIQPCLTYPLHPSSYPSFNRSLPALYLSTCYDFFATIHFYTLPHRSTPHRITPFIYHIYPIPPHSILHPSSLSSISAFTHSSFHPPHYLLSLLSHRSQFPPYITYRHHYFSLLMHASFISYLHPYASTRRPFSSYLLTYLLTYPTYHCSLRRLDTSYTYPASSTHLVTSYILYPRVQTNPTTDLI
ncbi:hypothetical protein C8R43DRAFT_38479 [Mycena crocata]|nr:hypothetical protein C8R43DRAFT_38479 [Mycena crocata]